MTACQADDGALELSGWTTSGLAADAALVVARRQSSKRVRLPVDSSSGAGHRAGFRARLPLAALTAEATKPTAVERALPSQDEVAWDLSLDPGRGAAAAAVRIGASAEAAGARVTSGGREITTTLTPFGSLSVLERSCQLLVSRVEWTPDGQLLFAGDQQVADCRPTELVLRRSDASDQHVLQLTWDDGHFSARVRSRGDASPHGQAAAGLRRLGSDRPQRGR